MSIKPDTWIKKMCKEHNMIEPFLDHQVSEGKISYGLSSMGYDVRISDEYRIFTNVNSSLVDPKNFSDENFIERKGPYCIIPPKIHLFWQRPLNILEFQRMFFVFVLEKVLMREQELFAM